MCADYDEFQKRDTEILVIGPEGSDRFKNYWSQNLLPFVGLPDPEHAVLKLFGQEVNLFKLGRMPAQMVIDKKGILRFVHYGHNMTDIPSNSELIEILDEVNIPV